MRVFAAGCAALCMVVGGSWSRAAAPAAVPVPLTLPLYATSASGAAHPPIDEELGGSHVLRNITEPTLTVYLPDPAAATGAGVIVAPGGAFMMLSIDYEGRDVARWLAAHGVAAFVLQYRLEPTPANDLLFEALLAKRLFSATHRSTISLPAYPGEALGVADALRALQLVKQNAGRWGLDPERVGFLGFSAGALIALRVGTGYAAGTRPAFIGSLYGVEQLDGPVRKDAPPLFLALAGDDPFFPDGAARLVHEWRQAGVPAELHVYERGGHGFGMKAQGATSDHWIQEFYWWLEDRGLLKPSPRRG
jgi:acetyl esterase/lipase